MARLREWCRTCAVAVAAAFELSPKGHRAALIKGKPTVSKMTADDFNRYTDADIESQAITWGVKEGQRERSCRLKLANFLESHRVTLVNLFLIIIDVVAVACELMLANVCEVSTHGSGGHRRMSGTGDSVEGEVEHQNEVVHHIEAALHWTSVSILCVFLVQQFLLMYALGECRCCRLCYSAARSPCLRLACRSWLLPKVCAYGGLRRHRRGAGARNCHIQYCG